MRNLWLQLKQWRNRLADVEEEKEKMQKKPDTKDFEKWYTKSKVQTSELLEKAEQFEDKIYQINKPKTHKYEINRTG